jgi:hypothetical protein
MPSCLLHNNVKIRIYKTIIFVVVLYGYKTSRALKEHKQRVSDKQNTQVNIVAEEGLSCRRLEKTGGFIICILRLPVMQSSQFLSLHLSASKSLLKFEFKPVLFRDGKRNQVSCPRKTGRKYINLVL